MGCRIEGETNWHYAKKGDPDGHQVEHNVLFEAIRSGKPVNAGDYMTQSTMVAVMGQIDLLQRQEVTWDQAEVGLRFPAQARGRPARHAARRSLRQGPGRLSGFRPARADASCVAGWGYCRAWTSTKVLLECG